MRKIKFTEYREFDYGEGLVVHEVGSTAELRDDKAQRWVTRGVAHYVDLTRHKAEARDEAKEAAEKEAEAKRIEEERIAAEQEAARKLKEASDKAAAEKAAQDQKAKGKK